jgi:hypothetical protein
VMLPTVGEGTARLRMSTHRSNRRAVGSRQ